MLVELGGGRKPRGNNWINVDAEAGPGVDIVLDFERLSPKYLLPFPDAKVDSVYTSHCLEHVRNLGNLMREIVRICKIGADVEIRVPSPLSGMALCHGHVQVLPDEQIDHWCNTATQFWFGSCERRLKHVRTERVPGGAFTEAKRLFPHLSNDQVMRFIPGACHEHVYYLEVILNEEYAGST
jgi:SAM-dependent methyltransferase